MNSAGPNVPLRLGPHFGLQSGVVNGGDTTTRTRYLVWSDSTIQKMRGDQKTAIVNLFPI